MKRIIVHIQFAWIYPEGPRLFIVLSVFFLGGGGGGGVGDPEILTPDKNLILS